MASILVATPAYGGLLTIPYFRSFVAMTRAAQEIGCGIATMITHSGFVSRARNTAAACVIAQPNFSHLLTIDADMGWPPEALPRLLDADKDIVGCTYPRRVLSERPSFIGGIRENSIMRDGFIQAEYVGCGFMLVKRDALVRMAEAYPERKHADETVKGPVYDLFPSGAPFGVPLSEANSCITDDVGFGRLARAIGLEVWADVMLGLTHTGTATFDRGPLINFLTSEKSP